MDYEKRLTRAPIDGAPWVWRHRAAAPHRLAVRSPEGFERPLVGMLRAWLAYADTHRARYESGIGADGVLGEEWASIGRALLGLLNGETGRLDCGTLDKLIRDVLARENFES